MVETLSSAGALAGQSVLVVDDEPLLRRRLAAQLERLGAEVTQAATIAAARVHAQGTDFDFALLDVHLPDGLGTDLLKEGLLRRATGVIVMTAQGAVEGAVEALKLGALDYLVKPIEAELVPLVLARARQARQSARAAEHADASRGDAEYYFGGALQALRDQMDKVLAADSRLQGRLPPVLITGETGTGKSSLARWLHRHGPRAQRPLVEVNCSALPETLAESELFGHERGAFTDARATRLGLFEAANGGTLFLDELPSLSLAIQAKVLTAIEDGQIRRLGGTRTIGVDVRIIAATSRDLKVAVAEREFREDLYHRLAVLRLEAPPLREWGEDIPRLAEFLLERFCARHRIPRRQITAAGLGRLRAHQWPGNVRELGHEIERALVFEHVGALDFPHLGTPEKPSEQVATGATLDWLNPAWRLPTEGFSLDDAINRMVQLALSDSGQNVSQAARRLGVTRDFVRYRIFGARRTGTRPDEDEPA